MSTFCSCHHYAELNNGRLPTPPSIAPNPEPVYCAICQQPLTGKHYLNYWGERYCLEHTETLAPCSYCGRLVPHTTKKMRRRTIDDVRCDQCAADAIENGDQARLLIPGLIEWLEAQGVVLRQKTFRLEVLDRTEFMSREGGRRDPLGLTSSTRFMRQKRVDYAKIEGVAILQGLPQTLFAGVAVHELGHVWLVQHNIVNLPLLDEEGFCELLAHRHYTESGNKAGVFYARRITENSSPVYGDGFRKLKQLEARLGFAQLIKSLLRKKKLPL